MSVDQAGNSHIIDDFTGLWDMVNLTFTIATSSEGNSWQGALYVLFGETLHGSIDYAGPTSDVIDALTRVFPAGMVNGRAYGGMLFATALFLVSCYLFYSWSESLGIRLLQAVSSLTSKASQFLVRCQKHLNSWLIATTINRNLG